MISKTPTNKHEYIHWPYERETKLIYNITITLIRNLACSSMMRAHSRAPKYREAVIINEFLLSIFSRNNKPTQFFAITSWEFQIWHK